MIVLVIFFYIKIDTHTQILKNITDIYMTRSDLFRKNAYILSI